MEKTNGKNESINENDGINIVVECVFGGCVQWVFVKQKVVVKNERANWREREFHFYDYYYFVLFNEAKLSGEEEAFNSNNF